MMTENISVVVLNSNFHTNDNYWLKLDDGDIAGMIAWFESELASLRAAGKRAYVLQHHPPLSTFQNYSDFFAATVSEYDDVVIAAFFGHSHDDEYFVFSSGPLDQPQPSIAGYIPGAGAFSCVCFAI